MFSELAHEQELTDQVKHTQKIMVMIGNPPYARFADMPDNPEEVALIAPYKACLRESWGVKKQLLDDLYIRFIRLAEWRVAEAGQAGVVSFITNRSYLTGISHPRMRQHLLNKFDHIYIDDLHGNQRSHRAGDGSVFLTESSGGIKVGVAIGTFVKLGENNKGLARVYYRQYTGSGESKRKALIEKPLVYTDTFTPRKEHRFVLRPVRGEEAFWSWPAISEVFPVAFNGVNTNRDSTIIQFTPTPLKEMMSRYFDDSISNEAFSIIYPELMKDMARYEPNKVRSDVLRGSKYDISNIVKYYYRPFDARFLYWEPVGKLLNEKRRDLKDQVYEENTFLFSSQGMRRGFDGLVASSLLADLHLVDPDVDAFPLHLRFKEFSSDINYQYLPNISDFYDDLAHKGVLKIAAPKPGSTCKPMPKPAPVLAQYGVVRGDDGKPNALAWKLAEEIFYHTLAVLSAPAYRLEHEEYLAEDWPRVPMPRVWTFKIAAVAPTRWFPAVSRPSIQGQNGALKVLNRSATLGRRVAALLDPQANPDVSHTVGRLVQPGTETEAQDSALRIGNRPHYEESREVYVLSDSIELAGVSPRVWAFTLGGYPVLKNWVEYRKDRALSLDDAEWLEGIVRRVSALLELGPELDGAYELAKGTPAANAVS